MRVGALAVTAAVALAACGSSGGGSGSSGSGSPSSGGAAAGSGGAQTKNVKVGMAYDVGGRGDKSFNDLAAAGLDKAKTTLGVQTKELAATQGESEQSKESRLTLLAQSGYNPIVAVGFAYATAVQKVVPKFPKTHFAIVDDAGNCTTTAQGGTGVQPNVTCLLFTENESSYLVGVAAALATKTKNVGFIGGVNEPLIQKFQAGFDAGVHVINKSIKIQVKYLTQPPDFGGFSDPAKGKTAALGMYAAGADVVYHAAGGSGAGLFDAAKQDNKLAIGVDSDQYQTAPANEKSLILTSALKGVDTAVYSFISTAAKGQFKAGVQRFSLQGNGVGYATSNPKIKPYEATINKYKQQIISGQITVPTKP
ncbi:BMP family protein [uncultured Jatrophihabitans sp.]|uniref:BMP family lipoprotein n=1 Tax=uncultured Jatrophihabitans sp. TaxID=1610747 RepID=UPI0035C9AB5D